MGPGERIGLSVKNILVMFSSLKKITIGKLPIMLKTNFCILNDIPNISVNQVGECKYDVGGYFIINGSEKVILFN